MGAKVIPCLQIQNNSLVKCKGRTPYLNAIQALLQLIPLGKVITYKELALLMGTSPRVIGQLLKLNNEPIVIPCHRVVRAECTLGGYTYQGHSNPELKRRLLELEGVKIGKNRINKECYYRLSRLMLS